jgi:hypothetical protein
MYLAAQETYLAVRRSRKLKAIGESSVASKTVNLCDREANQPTSRFLGNEDAVVVIHDTHSKEGRAHGQSAITVFTVPNPNCTSQRRRFFQVWLPRELPHRADHSVYSDLRNLLREPFRPGTKITYFAAPPTAS